MAMQIRLHDTSHSNTTVVPNTFIDNDMTKANGEYVKVYLYLLRCLNSKECSFSISKTADLFDHTEGDIKRALAYWEKAQLLRLEYDSDDNLTGIYFLHSKSTASSESKNVKSAPLESDLSDSKDDTANSTPVFVPAKPEYTKNELVAFSGREEIAQLLFISEQYLGRPMNSGDISNILYWYNELHFSADLIEYLIEYCVSKKHTSMHYIEKTAQLWYQQNITTPLQAKQLSKNTVDASLIRLVMNAMGIKGRNLASAEYDLVNTWSNVWKFSADLINEACRRTIETTHQPSFRYADSILSGWHKQKVKNLEDVARLDEAHKAKANDNAARPKKPAVAAKSKNKFSNFPQRSYDYEELERQLLLHS